MSIFNRSRPKRRSILVNRHPLAVRVTHWVNVLCVAVLLTSGLQIFNAHPRLYLGQASSFSRPVLAVETIESPRGDPRGQVRLLGLTVPTTGVFGVSKGPDGAATARAFPAWITLPREPDLATGRRFHFFFAWIFAANLAGLWLYGAFSGRFGRVLLPRWSDLRGIGATLLSHLRLRFDHGADGAAYNGLQKLTYVFVLAGLLPLMVASGLSLSPGVDAALPWLPALLGGRQTARSLHFLGATGLSLFIAVHLAMVALSGPINNLRTIITGRYAIPLPPEATDADD